MPASATAGAAMVPLPAGRLLADSPGTTRAEEWRGGRFDGRIHEGMAMRWSGERPTEQDLNEVRELRQPPALGRAAEQARRFYSYAYLAVDELYRQRGESGVRAMLRQPELLPAPGSNELHAR